MYWRVIRSDGTFEHRLIGPRVPISVCWSVGKATLWPSVNFRRLQCWKDSSKSLVVQVARVPLHRNQRSWSRSNPRFSCSTVYLGKYCLDSRKRSISLYLASAPLVSGRPRNRWCGAVLLPVAYTRTSGGLEAPLCAASLLLSASAFMTLCLLLKQISLFRPKFHPTLCESQTLTIDRVPFLCCSRLSREL